MSKRIILAVVLILGLAAAAVAEPAAPATDKPLTVKTFLLKHRDADKAAAAIKPLMSPQGSISIQPASNAISVSDKPENLKAIVAELILFDTEPQSFTLTVRLVGASRVDPSSAPRIPEDVKDVAPKLGMLRYNAFESLGQANVQGREGEPGVVDMQNGYRADFKIGDYDSSSDSVRIIDFKLSRLEGAGKDQLAQLLKTTLNLKLGQTVILGTARAPQSQRALMIVISAKR